MPLPRLALKHTVVPQSSGKKPELTAWTRGARYYAKGVGFLSSFVSDPPQYVPVGELDTENSVLVERGYQVVAVQALVTADVVGFENREREAGKGVDVDLVGRKSCGDVDGVVLGRRHVW